MGAKIYAAVNLDILWCVTTLVVIPRKYLILVRLKIYTILVQIKGGNSVTLLLNIEQ